MLPRYAQSSLSLSQPPALHQARLEAFLRLFRGTLLLTSDEELDTYRESLAAQMQDVDQRADGHVAGVMRAGVLGSRQRFPLDCLHYCFPRRLLRQLSPCTVDVASCAEVAAIAKDAAIAHG